tara:strand:+ start:82 stop:381 length:300 start_codon:yes stop_codon:yes gene_type:complete
MSKEIANQILTTAKNLNWVVEVRGSIMTIKKQISGREQFVTADMEYYSVLGLLPSTSAGSVWGTDGGGVGAISAMNTGVFTMNKSGGSKRVLAALAKLI